MRKEWPILVFVIFLVACNESPKADPNALEMEYMPSSLTGITFANKVLESSDRCINQYDYFYNGGGVGVGDFNHDGQVDLFFAGNDVPNRLYINLGEWRFEDQTELAGIMNGTWSTGVTVLDINGDGWDDIYVCNSGPDWLKVPPHNQLYVNQHDGTFKEEARKYGLDDPGLSTHAVFFDYDGDGRNDLLVLNHGVRNIKNDPLDWLEEMQRVPPGIKRLFSNQLYRATEDGFENVTAESGIDGVGFALGAAVADYDHDGKLDVFIANDYFIPDRLYLNDGHGHFTDAIKSKLSHTSFFSMGCAATDINNDGWEDLAVLDMTPADHVRSKTNMASMDVDQFRMYTDGLNYVPQYMVNSLFVNRGFGIMSEVGQMAGMALTDWSWAPLWGDFDHDGRVDLYVTNGIYRDVKNNDWRMMLREYEQDSTWNKQSGFDYLLTAQQTPLVNPLFRNQNGWEFEMIQERWGLTASSFSHGAVTADLDNDGDLDIVVNNLDQEAFLIRNNTVEKGIGNFLQIKLETNSCVAGTRVEVWTDQGKFTSLAPSGGYQSTSQALVHVGLGASTTISKVHIHQPPFGTRVVEAPKINSVVSLDDATPYLGSEDEVTPLFGNATSFLGRPIYHEEDLFDDFVFDVLLPHRQSRLGPGVAVGDVDGDGLEDFFLGGAEGQKSRLYLQWERGGFRDFPLSAEMEAVEREVLGAEFFDADADGDLDLYLAYASFADDGTDELYVNEGEGVFRRLRLEGVKGSTQAIVTTGSSNGVRLFIAGRTVPGSYPQPAMSSSILITGKDVSTQELIPRAHAALGMITDACEVQVSEGTTQTLVVGEWMEPSFLMEEGSTMTLLPVCPNLRLSGWWFHCAAADFDGDGDDDILLGNVGLNNKFHPSTERPLHCFSGDMDGNGSNDIVLAKTGDGMLLPVRGRECSSAQMPFIVDSFPSYQDFASSSLAKILGTHQLEEATHVQAATFESMILRNDNGTFIPVECPLMAQLSPIRSSIIRDFDGDGHLDILIAGNNTQTEVETVPYDAGIGMVLWGEGDCSFRAEHHIETTGLLLSGDVIDLKEIYLSRDSTRGILVVKNNGRLNLWVEGR